MIDDTQKFTLERVSNWLAGEFASLQNLKQRILNVPLTEDEFEKVTAAINTTLDDIDEDTNKIRVLINGLQVKK